MTVRKLKISCRGWVFRVYTHLEGDVSFSGFMLIKKAERAKVFQLQSAHLRFSMFKDQSQA